MVVVVRAPVTVRRLWDETLRHCQQRKLFGGAGYCWENPALWLHLRDLCGFS